MAKKKGKYSNKPSWKLYVGIFCAIGAVVMLSENLIASLVYAVLAFLLLRKGNQEKQNTADTKSEPVPAKQAGAPTVPVAKPAAVPESKSKSHTAEEPAQVPSADFTNKTYRVTGIDHYTDNLLELAVPNSNYDMTKKEIIDSGMTDQDIWEYEFYPSKLELQPEPDNPHDPNAIKVLLDDKLVGYIKSGSCKHLLNVINQDRFMGASCKIGGGKYKRVDEEYDYDKDKDVYTLDKGDKKFSIVLTVKEKIK